MAREYRFRILNVFAESTFGGNPLCVFEDGRGLSDEEMQALARQFNLSETTFILPAEEADAKVRVFTTGYEMRFAGHPALGTAHVVRDLRGPRRTLTLEFKAGMVPLEAEGERWSFLAPAAGEPKCAATAEDPAFIALLMGLSPGDLAAPPCWVDTGADQLLIPVATQEAVRSARPDAALFDRWPVSSIGRKTGYLFAFDSPARDTAWVRYFFTTQGGGVSEDPGTGSACANLGGWLLHTGATLPMRVELRQGDALQRPCRLQLELTSDRRIRVGGRVLQLGRGSVFV